MKEYTVECLECGNKTPTVDSRKKFCGRSCSAKYNNRKYPKRAPSRMGECPNCNERVQMRHGQVYCSRLCRQTYLINKWLNGEFDPTTKQGLAPWVRAWLIDSVGRKCEIDGWMGTNPVSGKTVLQVDHIDGRWYNNQRENLRVLCPNCHALTPSYGALNRGKGRTFRYAALV